QMDEHPRLEPPRRARRATSYGIPDCILETLVERDWVDADYHLASSGRAIGWVRMAADRIEEAEEQNVADYHAYAGVSSARTAIDAVASWLNVRLDLGMSGSAVDLTKSKFLDKLCTKLRPEPMVHLESL